MIINKVKGLFDNSQFAIVNNLILFINEKKKEKKKRKKVISFESILNIMTPNGFKSIVSQPMDEDIENYYTNLGLKINNSPVWLVFNMDIHPYHIFVPKEIGENIYIYI